jgi:alpha-glucosidase
MRASACLILALAGLMAAPAVAQKAGAAADSDWWKNAVIYEIYPRSFGDTNGDGVGDLNGITLHLDYLRDLGVDAIWITPFYPSPQVDFGYDISDYQAVDPQYGTMADFDKLVAEAGKRHIRVITDLVLNHTSDRHPWFLESRSSRNNPKADWYVWRNGGWFGRPPNNWISIFGHSAWQYDPVRRQYYYHAFYKEQPDLNWRISDVRKAMYDTMRFWMKRGVAGFRLDAVAQLFEDPQFRDGTVQPGRLANGDPIVSREYVDNLPEIHDVMREMRKVTDEFPGRILIAETYLSNIEELAKMYGRPNDETQLPMDTDFAMPRQLSAEALRRKLREAETGLNGNMPLFVTDNHDNQRSWDRFGDGKHNEEIARLVATLLLTPRATALLYYGQELGMENNDPKRLEDVKDPIGRMFWPTDKGRDGERTPMNWDATPNAGFSTASTTWLPVGRDHAWRNVAAESRDPKSLLNYYKALIRLRKENAALRDGPVTIVDENNPNVLSFLRQKNGATVLVALNFSPQPQSAEYDLGGATTLHTLLSSFAAGDTASAAALPLPGFGAYVGMVQ